MKTDKILERLNSIDIILAKQHVTLKEHIRRTEILEEAIRPSKILGLVATIAAIIESLHWMLR